MNTPRPLVAARATAIAALFAASAALAAVEYFPSRDLLGFAPPRESPVSISATESSIWLLHPDGYVWRWEGLIAEVAGEGRRVEVMRTEKIELPAERNASELAIAGASDTEAWLVDRGTSRLWRVRDGAWEGPWTLGEAVGALSASPGGLLVNTPSGSTLFAVVDGSGSVARRFGEPLAPPHEDLAPVWNQWAIATLADGRIAAAHRFSDAIRVYDASGELLRAWDAGRVADETDHAAVFATAVLATAPNRFAIRYGSAAALEEFDTDGRSIGSVPIAAGRDEILGLAARRDDLAVATPRGVVRFEKGEVRHLRGMVVTERGAAIGEASLAFMRPGGGAVTAHAAGDGRFSIAVPDTNESYQVTVVADRFRPWHHRGPLSAADWRRIVLLPTVEQCVHVFDAVTREPVEQLRLTLSQAPDAAGGANRRMATFTVAAPEGRACVEVPFDLPWTLQVAADGYAAKAVEVVRVRSDQPERIALEAGAVLEVEIRDGSGAAVEGMSLFLRATDAGVPVAHRARSGSDGIARIEGVSEGAYQLTGSHPRFRPFSREVSIDTSYQHERIEVGPGTTLSVTVTSENGPVTAAKVSLAPLITEATGDLPLACVTDEEGTCTIGALGPGRYQARAQAEGIGSGFSAVNVGDGESAEVDIHLTETVRLTGTIENRDDYPGLHLEVWLSKPGLLHTTVPVDARGEFTAEQVPVGTIGLSVEERNRNSSLLYRRLDIPAGNPTHHVVLRLPPPVTLLGRVTHRGLACSGCTVVARRPGAEVTLPSIQARVEPSGTYVVRLPGAGTWVVRASAPDGSFDHQILEIDGTATRDFDIGEGRITVVVKRSDGRSAAGARVHAIDLARGITLATVAADERGIATLPRPSGTARIVATAQRATGAVVYAPGGSSTVEIVLGEATGLRVDLRTQGGAPIPEAVVRLRSARTGFDSAPLPLVRSTDEPFELPAAPDDIVDLVVQARHLAPRTIHGLTGSSVHTITVNGGLALAVQVSPALRPCAFRLADASGRIYGLSTDYPLGPVPLEARESVFNPIERGEYVATLYTCDGGVVHRPASVASGYTASLVRFD